MYSYQKAIGIWTEHQVQYATICIRKKRNMSLYMLMNAQTVCEGPKKVCKVAASGKGHGVAGDRGGRKTSFHCVPFFAF